MGLTRQLGERVAAVAAQGCTDAAREAAKSGFVDSIGTMLAGRIETSARTMSRALQPLADGPCEEVVGFSRTTAENAALINGIAAHALDFDDVALRGHPSAVMVPAILATAQAVKANGRRMLDAYVAGYEVWSELVERETGMHHMKGWHPTGAFGAVGAAAACAVLRDLDATAAAHCLGLGATQSAGIMANFGSMAKPLQAGRAAQAGASAAWWAAHGFTAGDDVLEHEQGFLAAISPRGAVDRSDRPASGAADMTTWRIESRGLSVKKYPTCYFTHRALDGMLALLRRTPIAPDDVQRVDVTLSREHATVLRNHRPGTGMQAKFSIEFAMASALLRGKAGLLELCDEFVQSAEIQALMPRVHVIHSSDYDIEWSGASAGDLVSLTLQDGSRIQGEPVRVAAGHAKRPLSRDDLRAKFDDCLAYGNRTDIADALFQRLWNMQDQQAGALFSS